MRRARQAILALSVALAMAGAAPARVAAAAEPRPQDAAPLAEALAATRYGDFDKAFAALGRAPDPVARDIVEWTRLRTGAGGWDDYLAFLARHPDWPGLTLLRREAEAVIPANADPAQVVAFFGDAPPQTGAGVLRLAEAHAARGATGDAEADVVRAWRTLTLGAEEEAALIARYPALLKPHHRARLDMLLWRGYGAAARRLYPYVDEGWQRLAEARSALREMAPGVDVLIAKVPEALHDTPGLAYERFVWRARKGRDADAIALLRERSATAAGLGEPGFWAGRRAGYARQAMREGDAALAYEIAARHHLVEGADFAELEWLAGYIALRKLDRPALAVEHFRRFRGAVASPISVGRAGYWLGRAHEAAGEAAPAREAYALGAAQQTSFYGQLAAERAGLPPDPALTGAGPVPDWRRAGFAETPVLRAGLLLHHAGEMDLSERFFVHLAESLDPAELAQLGELLLDLGRPHAGLMMAKQAASRGVVLPKSYYPLTALAKQPLPVPMELALSIARRESEFDPEVVSPVGARGLMQLMPRTAEAMAARIGLQYSLPRLTGDWQYNATLGAAYLAQLIEQFGASPVLVSAAYNAGPSRAIRWIQDYGDPRMAGVDVVDWIETIPFEETRNYIMRVTESLHVYRARLSGTTPPLRLGAELASR